MKWLKLRRLLLRSTLVVFLLGGIFLGIAFLPGEVEGNYRGGFVSSCGCDSVTFINLREGKILTYHSAHPPAWLSGRYQKTNGAVELYLGGEQLKREEIFLMRAYPRFLTTKFVDDEEEQGILVLEVAERLGISANRSGRMRSARCLPRGET